MTRMGVRRGYEFGCMVLCRGNGGMVDCMCFWFVVLLLQMTPRFCGGVDVPEMIELLSGSCMVCVDNLVKDNGASVLTGHVLPVACVPVTLCFY